MVSECFSGAVRLRFSPLNGVTAVEVSDTTMLNSNSYADHQNISPVIWFFFRRMNLLYKLPPQFYYLLKENA